ncbi:MAG: hypothetical protein FJ000_05545 [Actinobacteria bacterium]|nr:hypothetical protein [Actinomycetota bacterium]
MTVVADDSRPHPAGAATGQYHWPSDDEGRTSEAYDLFVRGTAFLESGHPGQAAVLLDKAKRLTPGKTSVREALARSYYALGLFAPAAAEFAAVTEAAPCNDYAHFGLGCSLLRLGQPLRARASLRLAVAMTPQRDAYTERLSEVERRLGRARG